MENQRRVEEQKKEEPEIPESILHDDIIKDIRYDWKGPQVKTQYLLAGGAKNNLDVYEEIEGKIPKKTETIGEEQGETNDKTKKEAGDVGEQSHNVEQIEAGDQEGSKEQYHEKSESGEESSMRLGTGNTRAVRKSIMRLGREKRER
ncbi:hypothetical protein L1887_03111 [Cichorium endivia]|nr:hypothetical protein L1887_03111 [Cichorium endivia]